MNRLLSFDLRTAAFFLLPALLVLAGVLVPLAYLLIRAFEADAELLRTLVLRRRNAVLLGNTLLLAAGVLALGTALAFPLAWLTTRTRLRGRRVLAVVGVLPLAVPGYVMAYALLGATGGNGLLAAVAGLTLPRPGGYTGALLALGLTLYPYLFLNLRAALLGLDASVEEAARALGYTNRQVFLRVILPQLRPAFLAGGLLIGLHVLGDFGVVSLMRYETFSYALYLQYAAAFDRVYAAWLALMLLALTGALLVLEARLLRGRRFHRAGAGGTRQARAVSMGGWTVPAYAFAALLSLAAVGLPVGTALFWMMRDAGAAAGWTALAGALGASVTASVPAAVLAGALALPLAYRSVCRPSPAARVLERVAYLGYATPPLAFALAFIFFTLRTAPVLYQTLALLVIAYALHFLAEAIGPVRSALYQASPRLEEAARALGRKPLQAFFTATFPLLRRGLLVSIAFVFLSAMKELPITFLLSPIGFETLALGVWGAANEALFGRAAPYALLIILFSAAFVGLLLAERDELRAG
ncbi:MAG: ABC transporter permease [Rhodothermaceae bacterium]|nr:MAG: ABC transporter permease [Rhodothermaceae bacterium]